ncbi:MAG: NfeD family protein [Deltaproteobacteria bacterium]|nr:NfeD family protein [Deltaproteobacteria bacterium]
MVEWFVGLSAVDKVFLICAVVGGLLFLVRVVLMFMGSDGDTDVDVHVDGGGAEVDVHVDADGHADGGDSDAAFRLLSLQGITAFFMMFGLVGLAMSRGSGLHALVALGGGIAAGVASVWIVDRLFRVFGKLQHSGTMNLRNAIGQEGTVYLRIPEGDTGKARVAVQGRLKVFNAVSEDKTEISTDARVKVVDVVSGNVLVVKKV